VQFIKFDGLAGRGSGRRGQSVSGGIDPVGNRLVADTQGTSDAPEGEAVGVEAEGLIFEGRRVAISFGQWRIVASAQAAAEALASTACGACFGLAQGGRARRANVRSSVEGRRRGVHETIVGDACTELDTPLFF